MSEKTKGTAVNDDVRECNDAKSSKPKKAISPGKKRSASGAKKRKSSKKTDKSIGEIIQTIGFKRIALIVGAILVLFYLFKPSEDSVQPSSNRMIEKTTTFAYNDAIDYQYNLVINIDGSALLQLKTSPKDELQEYAYARERKGVRGSWEESLFSIGNSVRRYIDVHLPNGSTYISSDGYVYNSFDDLQQMRNGFKYRIQ